MSKALTKEEFILRSRKIHGDKYDYSKCIYIDNRTKVCIICRKHGEFEQNPSNHMKGYGCKKCTKDKFIGQNKIFGYGTNDYLGKIRIGNKIIASYSHWLKMMERCYSLKKLKKYPSYKNCTVCPSWMYFSNFKKWFDKNYISGYELDKDILIKGNKMYSPLTCCFVPKRINTLFINNKKNRGEYLIGVYHRGKKFQSYLQKCCKKPYYIGTFYSEIEAFNSYKIEKEKYIKEIANKYYNENKINKIVYDAMYNYKIEISD